MDEPIVNRVQESGLIQVDLSSLLKPRPVSSIDVAQWLDNGFILREKPFRDAVAQWDASPLAQHIVALVCTTDAILPDWAWMLVAAKLNSTESTAIVGSLYEAQALAWREAVYNLELDAYRNERVIVKGCAAVGGPDTLVTFTNHVGPVVRILMFGEACSAVPLVKNPRP